MPPPAGTNNMPGVVHAPMRAPTPPPMGVNNAPGVTHTPLGAPNPPGVTQLPFAPRQQQAPPARAMTPEAREEKRRRLVNMEAMQGNSEYHDLQVRWGRMLPRAIPATRYNERDGLAGRDPLEVRLHEVVHDGVQNFGLRLMANGDFYRLEILRSIEEQLMVAAILKRLRVHDNAVYLLGVQRAVATSKGIDTESWEGRQRVWNIIAEEMYEKLGEIQGVRQSTRLQGSLDEFARVI